MDIVFILFVCVCQIFSVVDPFYCVGSELHSRSMTFKISVTGLVKFKAISWDTAAAAAAKSLQSCPTLRNPIDGSPPGSPVPGMLQARTLEWVAISFSNAWKWKVKVKSLSCARLLVTPWTAAHQAPPSIGFSRQEYWSGVPLVPSLIYNKLKVAYFPFKERRKMSHC